MPSIRLLQIFFSLLVSCAAAADLCSSNNLTKIEKQICDDHELVSLDRSLNEAYTYLMGITADKASLKAKQIDWIKTNRNICPDRTCLAKTYTDHIINIIEQAETEKTVSTTPLSSAEKSMICNAAFDMEKTNSYKGAKIPGLPISATKLTTNKNWVTTQAMREQIQGGGYDGDGSILNIKLGSNKASTRFYNEFYFGNISFSNLVSEKSLTPSDKYESDWVPTGNSEADEYIVPEKELYAYSIYFNKRNLVVSSLGNSTPTAVSLIEENGKFKPICLLKNNQPEFEKYKPKSTNKSPYCAALLNGRADSIKWKNVDHLIEQKPNESLETAIGREYDVAGQTAEAAESITIENGTPLHFIKFESYVYRYATYTYILRATMSLTKPLKVLPNKEDSQLFISENLKLLKIDQKALVLASGFNELPVGYQYDDGRFIKICEYELGQPQKIDRLF